MIITIGQALNFDKFYQEIKQQKVKFCDALDLYNIRMALDQHLFFYNKQLSELTKEYSEGTLENDQIIVSKERADDFLRAVTNLLEIQIELNITQLDSSSLGSLEISIEQLEWILPFIKEEQVTK